MEQKEHDMRVLIEKSAQSDAESCKKLYTHLIDKVYPYVRHRTDTEEQAVDLTQDVFIDLFVSLPNFTYQSQTRFYAYVFVIVKRKLAKHYAESSTRQLKTQIEFDENTIAFDTDTPTRLEHAHDVERALSSLDTVAREIVVLRHWSRHSFVEIAAFMDMTESAVRVRHHRALQSLATKLDA